MVTATLEDNDTAEAQMIPTAEELTRIAKFKIPGDVVASATEKLPESQRAAVRWFAGYCRQRNISPKEGESVLRKSDGTFYSWHSIYSVLTGIRSNDGVGMEKIAAAMEEMKIRVEGDSRVGTAGYIHTRMSRAMWERLDLARERRKIAFIFGDSQLGKTTVGREYQRTHNHGETIFLDTPSSGTKAALVHTLGDLLDAGSPRLAADRERRIKLCFSAGMLLVLDNAHRMLRKRIVGLDALTFLQEIYDQRGCALGLMQTYEGKGELEKSMALRQLWRRRVPPLLLPNRTPDDDLGLFAARFGLAPAVDDSVTFRIEYIDDKGKEREREMTDNPLALQTRVIETEGLGVWLETLEEAKRRAAAKRRPISWTAVVRAHCAMQAQEEVLS